MEKVEQGDTILEFFGKRVDVKKVSLEMDQGNGENVKYAHGHYLMESWNGSVVIDASDEKASKARYANHHCDANAFFETIVLKTMKGDIVEVIFLKALRDIRTLEEVTVKYKWKDGDQSEKPVSMVCNCLDSNCEKYIGIIDKNRLLN